MRRRAVSLSREPEKRLEVMYVADAPASCRAVTVETLDWQDSYAAPPSIEAVSEGEVVFHLCGRPDGPLWKDWAVKLVTDFCAAHEGAALGAFTQPADGADGGAG